MQMPPTNKSSFSPMSSKTNKLFLALAHLGPSWSLLGICWPVLELSCGAFLGSSFRPMPGQARQTNCFGVSQSGGPSWPVLGLFWHVLDMSWGYLGSSFSPMSGQAKTRCWRWLVWGGHLGVFWAYFGLSWSCLGLSWGYLGAFLGSSFSPMSGQAKKTVYFCVGPVRGPSWLV